MRSKKRKKPVKDRKSRKAFASPATATESFAHADLKGNGRRKAV